MSEFEQMLELSAQHAVAEALAKYRKTGNGLLIWEAYRDVRNLQKKGAFPMPEPLLEHLDKIMSGLLNADSKDAALEALDLKQSGGGGWKSRQRQKIEKQYQVVQFIATKIQAYPAIRRQEVYEEAAERFDMKVPNIKKLLSQWRSQGNRQRHSVPDFARIKL